MPSIDTPVVSKTGVQPAGVVRSDAGGTLVSTDGYFTLLQVDANGALRVTGGGGGTEYTEDAAAAANPVGGAQILVRQDTPASEVSTNGDNIARRGTAYGAAYSQIVTSTGSFVDSFGGGTEYTEDAAAAANPLGKANILVRSDTPASEVSTNGDNIAQRGTAYGAAYCQILDSSGNFVNTFGGGSQYTEGDIDATITGTAAMMEVGSNTLQPIQGTVADGLLVNLGANNDVTVTSGAITETNSGAIKTAVELLDNAIVIDDAAFTPAVTGVMMAGFTFDDTAPDSVNEGDAGAARMSANRNIYTTIRDAAGNERGLNVAADGSIAITVATIPSHAVTNAGTFVVQENGSALTALQLIDDTVATTAAAITTKGIAAAGTDGTNARILKTDASGELQIDVLTLPASTNTIEVVGDVAHDAAISGNPVRIGGRALTADYTAVAAGDVADLITTLLGKLVTIPFANPNNTWNYAAASGGIVNTTGVTIKAAAGAGVRNYITCLSVINGHATTSTDVQIRDGASGTVIWRGFAQAAGGGVREVFSIPLRGTANTLLEVACGTTGAAVYVNVCGYTAAE